MLPSFDSSESIEREVSNQELMLCCTGDVCVRCISPGLFPVAALMPCVCGTFSVLVEIAAVTSRRDHDGSLTGPASNDHELLPDITPGTTT